MLPFSEGDWIPRVYIYIYTIHGAYMGLDLIPFFSSWLPWRNNTEVTFSLEASPTGGGSQKTRVPTDIKNGEMGNDMIFLRMRICFCFFVIWVKMNWGKEHTSSMMVISNDRHHSGYFRMSLALFKTWFSVVQLYFGGYFNLTHCKVTAIQQRVCWKKTNLLKRPSMAGSPCCRDDLGPYPSLLK